MPKKAAGRKRKRTPAPPHKRKGALVAVCLTLSLVSAGAALALWGPKRVAPIGSSPAAAPASVAFQSQNSFSPASPAKEYIYAGGRHVATEEPTPTPTPVPTPTPPPPCTPPTTLIISEFRLRGSAGPNDEFIEFYNNADSAITVCTADQTNGWTLAARNAAGTSASPVFTIPYGTVIPARAHYLAVNNSANGYSLSNHPAGSGTTATGNITYTTDIEDNVGIALFVTSNPAGFTLGNRLDAVGSTSETSTLYREGTGYPPVTTGTAQYSFYRDLCAFAAGVGCTTPGVPKDTNNNSADFLFIDTNGTNAGAGQRLGAPGPENLSSPIQRNNQFSVLSLDATIGTSSPPNRVRDFTSDPANNSTFGTLSIRRRIVNSTGAPVTRLRLRVSEVTTFPAPAGVADMRPRTSSAVVVSNINDAGTCLASTGSSATPCTVTVQGTTLEQPANQPNGGGYNSTLSVGTVALATPLAPGASVNVQFLLGLQQTGSFRFYINVEALP